MINHPRSSKCIPNIDLPIPHEDVILDRGNRSLRLLRSADKVDSLPITVPAAVLPALAVVVVDHHESGGQALPVDLQIAGLMRAGRLAAGAVACIATSLLFTNGRVGLRHRCRGGNDGGGKTLHIKRLLVFIIGSGIDIRNPDRHGQDNVRSVCRSVEAAQGFKQTWARDKAGRARRTAAVNFMMDWLCKCLFRGGISRQVTLSRLDDGLMRCKGNFSLIERSLSPFYNAKENHHTSIRSW